MATGGNLMILDDTESSSDGRPLLTSFKSKKNEETPLLNSLRRTNEVENKARDKPQGSFGEFHFVNEEAGIVIQFFKDELTKCGDLGGLTSREPSVGQPTKVTIKCAKEKHLKDLQISIETIRNKLLHCTKEYVKYTFEKADAEEYVKNSTGNSKTLLYLDATNNQVCVAGPNYGDVKSEVHKLKVHLGQKKPTAPRSRGVGTSYASVTATSQGASGTSNRYPDYSSEKNRSFSNDSRDTIDSVDVYVEEALSRSLKLKVYKASILKLNVDVIVNAANETLMHGGGVARIIADAAGYELEDESKDYVRKNYKVKVTQNCVTTAGNLRRYKGVIHAVGPQWYMYSMDKVKCLDDLYDTVTNILNICGEKRYNSVAMPAISAGIFGVPKTLCADMYVKAVTDFSKKNEQYPQEFHIVDIDTEILSLVKGSFIRWKEDDTSIDQIRTVPVYMKEHQQTQSSYNSGGLGRGYRGNRNFKSEDDGRFKSESGRGRHGQGNCSSSFDGRRGGSSSGYGHTSSSGSGSGYGDSVGSRSVGGHGNGGDSGTVWYDDNPGGKPFIAFKVQHEAGQKIGKSITADCFKVNEAGKVVIYNGAIDKVGGCVDAVVCAAHENLYPAGDIAKALESAGGYKYTDALMEMRKDNHYKKKSKGDVAVSRGGDLKVGHVIHLVLPRVSSEKDLPVFKTAMSNVLEAAEKKKFRAIALPLIGTGGILNKDRLLSKFCDAFVETVCELYAKHASCSVKEIHLVNKSPQVRTALNTAFANFVGRSPMNSIKTRPLPQLPNAEGLVPMEVDDDDDTYEKIDSYRKFAASDMLQSKRREQSSEKKYDAMAYRDRSDSFISDDDDAGGRQTNSKPTSSGQSPADSSEAKTPGNLLIIDDI